MQWMKAQLRSLLQVQYYVFAIGAVVFLKVLYNHLSADGIQMQELFMLMGSIVLVNAFWWTFRLQFREMGRSKMLPRAVQKERSLQTMPAFDLSSEDLAGQPAGK